MRILFSLAILMGIICLVGCQENIPTDPITDLSKPSPQIIRDRIPFCCDVSDPRSGVCKANGCVEYIHEIIATQENQSGVYTISIKLHMNSKLCDKCMMMHPEWLIKGNSEETINVSEEGIALFYKSYNITNREDIVLYVQYLVTTEGVGIVNMAIVEVENQK